MDDDTAAILSELPEIDEWEEADFAYLPDGEVVVTIETEDGTFQVILPDHDAAGEVWDYCEENDVEHDSHYEDS